METPDGKMQTITVPAGNFSVSKRPVAHNKTTPGGGSSRKRSAAAAVMSGHSAQPPAQQLATDRNLYSILGSSVRIFFSFGHL
jgi:hypothetical protein